MSLQSFSNNARWIWGTDDTTTMNWWRYFRLKLNVPDSIRSATLLITADSRYECALNEKLIGRGPVRAYPFAYAYDVYDIIPYLHAGKNLMAVLVNYLGDHTMGYMRGAAGFLCEIIIETDNGEVVRFVSDAHWKTTHCDTFASNVQRISLQLEFEEQYDTRCEMTGWQSLDFDDRNWPSATELGGVGVEPWTSLQPSTIPPLTENPTAPIAIKAVELAQSRPGIIWSLDLREQIGAQPTGLQSAPPGKRGSILFTEVIAPIECQVNVHFFPNYEDIQLRINDQTYSSGDPMNISDSAIFTLKAGRNLVMLRDAKWPTLFFECEEDLQFSAERFVDGAAWVVIAPLNELQDEVDARFSVAALDDLPPNDVHIGIPMSANKLDIFALTVSQTFHSIHGGFTSFEIARATPRLFLKGNRPKVVDAPDSLLHDNNQWAVLYPQPDGDLHLVIDFGREIVGYPRIELDAPSGAIVDANCFEGIDDGGIFWMRNLRNTFRYTCRDGHQTFTSHQRRGFRYMSLTVRNFDRPVKIRHVDTLMATYPVEAKGHFASSDETLNKIWEVGAYTVKLCMLDTYVDCPGYEQVYWVGDARNSALVNAVAFGAYALTDRCVRLTGQSLSEKMIEIKPLHLANARPHLTTAHCVTGWFSEIPMWTFLWIWMAWEQYGNTGDHAALADYYVDIKECLHRCEGFLSERDLLDIPDVWNLVDWAAQDLERDGEVISNTALMAKSLGIAALMAEELGYTDEIRPYQVLAKRLRNAINQHGWSDEFQGYVDTVRDLTAHQRYVALCQERGVKPLSFNDFHRKQRISEPTNTIVMLCDCVIPERYDAVMKFVTAATQGQFSSSSPKNAPMGKPDEIVPVGSPWFLFFTLETLFKEGYPEDALNILRNQWNRMLEKGATTFWETFPGNIGRGHWSRSLCHGWSAAPTYFLSTQILGVTPTAPGFTHVRIAPKRFHLTWARGTVPTPYGVITVSWYLDETNQMQIEYDVPTGIEVEVIQG